MSSVGARPHPQLEDVPRRRIRVLSLIKGLGPGGAERLLALGAEVFDRQRFHHEVAYLLPWKDQLVPPLKRAGLHVHCLGGGAEWDLRWALRLRILLLEGRFDIVHVHSPYVASFARLVVRCFPLALRPLLISTEHVPWSGYAAATRALNRLTFSLDASHIAVSEAVRESIPGHLRHRVDVVLHGIAVDRIRERAGNRRRARVELGVGEGEVLIATVANLRAQKGYPCLLEAARRLVQTGLPVRFIAVGHGPLERELHELHESLGLGDRFVFLGYREDPIALLAGADVFVLSSLYEGLPLALMEALALGLPVVATDVTGIRETVRNGVEAILVPSDRGDLLAAALERLVRDGEERSRLAAASRLRAPDFDVTRAVRRVEAIYRATVAAASSADGARS